MIRSAEGRARALPSAGAPSGRGGGLPQHGDRHPCAGPVSTPSSGKRGLGLRCLRGRQVPPPQFQPLLRGRGDSDQVSQAALNSGPSGFNPLFGEEGTRTMDLARNQVAAAAFQPPLRGRGDSDIVMLCLSSSIIWFHPPLRGRGDSDETTGHARHATHDEFQSPLRGRGDSDKLNNKQKFYVAGFQPPLRGRGDSDTRHTASRLMARCFNPLFGEEGTRTDRPAHAQRPEAGAVSTPSSGKRGLGRTNERPQESDARRFNPLFGEEGTRTSRSSRRRSLCTSHGFNPLFGEEGTRTSNAIADICHDEALFQPPLRGRGDSDQDAKADRWIILSTFQPPLRGRGDSDSPRA